MQGFSMLYKYTFYFAFCVLLIECSFRPSMSIVAMHSNNLKSRRNTESTNGDLISSEKSHHDIVAASSQKPSPTLLQSIGPILAASFCTAAIMYPLDLIRALKMANAGAKMSTAELLSNFRKAHGYTGFFTQGLVPELARSTWMRFIKFSLFPVVHVALTGLPESKGSGLSKAVVAIISSIPEAISIMPLEISKIALQLDAANAYKNNMFKAMAAVFKDQGLAGFKMGYVGVQYRQAAWSAGYFASLSFFEQLVSKLSQIVGMGYFEATYPDTTKTVSTLLAGFLAGVFGASINTPGDTIRTVIQKRGLATALGATGAAGSTRFLQVGREIYAAKGLAGLYAGFGFKAFHLGGGGALMAFFIPFFKNLLMGDKVEVVLPSPLVIPISTATNEKK